MNLSTIDRSLSPRERKVLERVAGGASLGQIVEELDIREGTVMGYLKAAKVKLHGVKMTPSAVAVGYATQSISRPQLTTEALTLSRDLRLLVPLIAMGWSLAEIASWRRLKVYKVQSDCHRLHTILQARSRPHMVTRAWQYKILTEQQVTEWIHQSILRTSTNRLT